jgi:hypothetical protein
MVSYAESMYKANSFSEAERVGQNAIKKKNTARANLIVAKAEIEKKKDKEAIKHLESAIKKDNTNVECYKLLINLYYNRDQMNELYALKLSAATDDVKKLFDNIVIGKVEFSIKPGKYTDDQKLYLRTNSEYKIYYSEDGSTPDETFGTKYDEKKPITLKKGTTTIKAALIDSKGRMGKVFVKKYKIAYLRPKDPEVTPESGAFTTPTQVTISAGSECRIFYTWDGTDPDINSEEYTGPIDVPEGNNVFSVVVIDKHDMVSNVIRKNYVYNP